VVIGLYTTSGKISLQAFLALVVQTDAALKALLLAVTNLGVALLVFIGAGYVPITFGRRFDVSLI
jgi:hypothetical protein